MTGSQSDESAPQVGHGGSCRGGGGGVGEGREEGEERRGGGGVGEGREEGEEKERGKGDIRRGGEE